MVSMMVEKSSKYVRMGKGGWDGEERWIKNIIVPHSLRAIL